ncbi:hypothetical protein J6Q66_04050 [bacterium]|nr:hypothetical protein [bacterium]
MGNNFNVGQFVSSFLRFSAQTIMGKSVKGTANNFTQLNNANQQLANTQNLQIKNMLEIPKIQLEMLNSLDKGALVKDLMNLPKDFTQLISMFTTTPNGNMQNAFLDVAKLINFLQQNGEQGKQNLLNLIVSINKAGFTQTEQLKELGFIINACMPSAQNSNATVMKNLILLYLPWLPLGEGMGFDIEVRNSQEDEKGEDDDSVMIYIQTQNFGSIKVLLKVENKTKVLLQISCDEKFPKNIAEKRFKEEVQSFNIKTEFNYSLMKQENNENDVDKDAQTRVNVDTSRHINPLLMMAAHSIIKIIFEIDKNILEVNSNEK